MWSTTLRATGRLKWLARDFPEVELTRQAQNVGFAAATNHAIVAGDAPTSFALNPDCEVREGALDRLVETLETRSDVGIAGPAVLRPDGGPDHAAHEASPRPSTRWAISRDRAAPAHARRQERLLLHPHARRQERLLLHPYGRRSRRRRQRRFHADTAPCLDPGGLIRKGLLALHGRPRPVLSRARSRMAYLVRARCAGHPPQGRQRRRGSQPPADLRVPLWDVALLPGALCTGTLGGGQHRRLPRHRSKARSVLAS